MFSYPTVHTQQSSVPNSVAEHNVTVVRAFTKLLGVLTSQMQLGSLQYFSQIYEGRLGALPLPLGPCGTYDDTVGLPAGDALRHGRLCAGLA